MFECMWMGAKRKRHRQQVARDALLASYSSFGGAIFMITTNFQHLFIVCCSIFVHDLRLRMRFDTYMTIIEPFVYYILAYSRVCCNALLEKMCRRKRLDPYSHKKEMQSTHKIMCSLEKRILDFKIL